MSVMNVPAELLVLAGATLVVLWIVVQRRRSPGPASVLQMKIVAVGLLAIPALLLAILAIGEMVSGDVAGVQHVPEALALVVLAAAAWRHPRPVGVLLLVAGAVLLAVFAALTLTTDGHDSAADQLLVAAVLFGPPLVAGWLLYTVGTGPRPRMPWRGHNSAV